MTESPRVIVIDDEPIHLACLADRLDRHGVRCRRIHYTGEIAEIDPCPDVRLIFADLHLGSGALATNPSTEFSVIGALLERAIKPSGPYLLLLWTLYPNYASELKIFLERLDVVARPVAVLPLAKADHLDGDGNVRDELALIKKVDTLAGGWARPQGAIALTGAWGEIDDRDVDQLIEEIYMARRNDTGRHVELED